ncbi:hypothetical protein [Psychrobacillus sp. INOP01]|nr:hypothetical protein [Psychrobacillus sp. INOP01]
MVGTFFKSNSKPLQNIAVEVFTVVEDQFLPVELELEAYISK